MPLKMSEDCACKAKAELQKGKLRQRSKRIERNKEKGRKDSEGRHKEDEESKRVSFC